MVNKAELRDWLNESGRNQNEYFIESYIDEKIKFNALQNKTTFLISTGERVCKPNSKEIMKTDFFDIWFSRFLSEDNQRIVQENILRKYKENGFNVKIVTENFGGSYLYDALQFRNIHITAQEGEE